MTQTTQVEPRVGPISQPEIADPLGRILRWVRFDLRPAHRQPVASRIVLATVASALACLTADWLLARAGVAIFPSTKGYPHFQFGDYSTLTVLGVLAAGAGWPVVTRLCSAPRWLFARSAFLVTGVLLLPDLYIYLQGQPGRAVSVLVAMHLAIGIITYHLLVRLAPPRAA
jgi:hypothetical protein